MKAWLILISILAIATPCFADDYSRIPTEQLIDRLTMLDQNAPGIDAAGVYDAFLAEDKPARFKGGIVPTKPPAIPPAMREIVRRGADALPVLIAHLEDKRATKFQAGVEYDSDTFGGQFYSDEYDARIGVPCSLGHESEKNWCSQMPCGLKCPVFRGKYTVKVADVCEVLIGNIVNRRLSAVRYQPTNILYVNSPIEQPSLAAHIRKDWSNIDSAGLEAALLDDLRVHPERFVDGALRRLRFYYPATYTNLKGVDKAKRDAFEAEEKWKARPNE